MLSNPLFEPSSHPFEAPSFDVIETQHYLPAFERGMKEHQDEIGQITRSSEPPTFDNTVVAFEQTGEMLARVSGVFSNLLSAETSDAMQDIARQIVPRLSQHSDDILLDEALFQRIDTVFQQQDRDALDTESRTLLERTHRMFLRNGAHLDDSKKQTLRQLNEELATLTLTFRDNVLAETNAFELVLEEADLDGIPDSLRRAAAENARKRDHDGKWAFTLHGPSFIPFLQHSTRRDLREQLYLAYVERGAHGNDHDNRQHASRIAALRARRAQLLGYTSHAHYKLEDTMAETPQRVYELLDKLWPRALKRAQGEVQQMQAIVDREGGGFEIAPWDWWFYAEKVRRETFELDEAALQPYFSLDRVCQGAFDVAQKLFGLTFEERTDLPIYHDDVRTFEVRDGDGSHVGLFYTDFHARDSKRVGAWMNAYRKQGWMDDTDIRPQVSNVCNFPAREGDAPVLLRSEEVNTLFHEFGHALHGLLSRCRYRSLSGTSVPRDFVEVPSQIMENWAFEPEVLASYARHHETGEVIPDDLVEKLRQAAQFNQGFATVEYLAASYLDMDWHALEDDTERDAEEQERHTRERIDLPKEIAFRYCTPYFAHSFSSGYSAGYYSYIWAEVLDADGFDAFKEAGDLFAPQVATSWRENVLEKGRSEPPMTLYKRFRGREPQIEPLLERRGLA